MFRDSRVLLVVAVAVALWVPLARMEWFDGDEKASYIWRTVEWATELKAGVLYPRWCPDFYGGYGSPLFVFYGPVIYGVAGLLTATFLSAYWALKVVMLCCSVIAGVATYALVFGETRQHNAALVGAMAYLASPYRIGDLYSRGDLGEFAALALLPVVIAIYRAAGREALPRRARHLTIGASVLNALLIMSHPVVGMWGTLVVGLVVAATAANLIAKGLARSALVLILALVCAPGLAAVYVLPAIAYRDAAHTASMVIGFYKPQDQWLPFHALFEEIVPIFGRNYFRLGPLIALASVVVLAGIALNFRRARFALGWLALTAVLVWLTLPQGAGFWAPGRVPLSQFIQFPWRLLGPASLTVSVALGIGMAAIGDRLAEQTNSRLALVTSTALLLGLAWPYVSAPLMPIEGVPADSESIRVALLSATDADEYLPLVVAAPPTRARAEVVASMEGAALGSSHSDGSRNTLEVQAKASHAVVHLSLYAFPGWRVDTLSGPGKATLENDPNGLLRVNLPVAGAYRVRVSYGTSPAERLGAMLSVLSVLGLGLLLLRGSAWWQAPMSIGAT